MPPVTAAETQATLLETVRTLPSESQRAVLSYALFLRQQDECHRLEASEAEWDRQFSQSDKIDRFAEWARQSLTDHPPESFDDLRL